MRRRFGIVFQDPSLDGELTAYENMELHGVLYHVPRRDRVERIRDAAEAVRAVGPAQTQVKKFSGGMKRRLEIARGLLHTPKILFLDEPTLGLDPQSRNQLWTHVRHLNETEGVTVFLTTHYMDEAERVAQRIAIIDHGRIVAQGSPQELKQQTGTDSLEGRVPRADRHVDPRRDRRAAPTRCAKWPRCGGDEPMNVIYILWLREVKKYLRSRPQIIASLGQPLMYLLALGFGLGPVFQKSGQGNYLQFIAPGVIGMSMLFTSIFSGVGLLWDRQFGFLKETLVAPVPRLQIMIGRTLGGATIAMIQGTLVLDVCLIAGFRPQGVAALPLAVLFMALIAIVFAALGTIIGSTLRDMQGFQMIMNFLVMPIFFLSGALFPLANLPAALDGGDDAGPALVRHRRPARGAHPAVALRRDKPDHPRRRRNCCLLVRVGFFEIQV